MSYLTKEQWVNLPKEIKRLEKLNEEIREERIQAGLPPEPPANFVPSSVIAHIYQNSDIKRLHAYVVRLAKLALDSHNIPPIKKTDVLGLIPYYELLRWSEDGESFRLDFTASIFKNYEDYSDYEKLARRLHLVAGLLRDEYGTYARYDYPCICKLTKQEDGHICDGQSYAEGRAFLTVEITDDYLAELLEEARKREAIFRKEQAVLRGEDSNE